MRIYTRLFWILIILLAGCSDKRPDHVLTFSVIGDVPRSIHEDTLLQRQIEAHNQYSPSEFMIHVGDIKSGGAPCDEEVYRRVSGFLLQLSVPTFIVPGDNEWNDCAHPDSAWHFWSKYFIEFDKNWPHEFALSRQEGAAQNIAWVSKHILLIGVNLVGGRIHEQSAWTDMMEKAGAWIGSQLSRNNNSVQAAVIFAQAHPREKHALFMEKFLQEVNKFEKPVLFIHGDGHRWLYNRPWHLPNLTRVQVDQGRIALPLEVTVDVKVDSIFQFERKPFSFAYELK